MSAAVPMWHDPSNNNCPINADPRNVSCGCTQRLYGWLMNDELFERTPIWLCRGNKRVSAEIWSGPYIGTDGVQRYDSGSVYNLQSDECCRVFGTPYPFGSMVGGDVSYYLKNGAVIRLRTAEATCQPETSSTVIATRRLRGRRVGEKVQVRK